MIQRGETLRDQAYDLIRKKIITRELQFGAKLSVAELSREFGLSNSPIREAISLLEVDGLVVNNPNHGFKVIDFTQESFSNISQAAHVIISGCFEKSAYSNKLGELEKLLYERLEKQKKAYSYFSTYEYTALAIDFDRAFIDVCHNPMLDRMFDGLLNLLALCTLYVYADDKSHYESNLTEHIQIWMAVRDRDISETRRLIDKHYDKSNIIVQK